MSAPASQPAQTSDAARSANAALTGAMLVADPEMTVPILAATHPKKTAGALLLAYAVYVAMIGAVLFFIGFTRPLGKLVLAGAFVLGLSGGYLLFHNKPAPAKAQ